jgi:hypothetical protein
MRTTDHELVLDDYLEIPTTFAVMIEAGELFVQVRSAGNKKYPAQRIFLNQTMMRNLVRYSVEQGMNV